ncbi:MAG: hypothetical protein KIT22_06690 [Verrucomicrobiae bacterium]|nr:hypothetical protein [Verrucomicrobiae bacterium]
MMRFFAPNIRAKGRVLRGMIALALFAGTGFAFAFAFSPWLVALLAASGAFTAFEACRSWCVLRACGIKTRL